jgi:hypothetical protein
MKNLLSQCVWGFGLALCFGFGNTLTAGENAPADLILFNSRDLTGWDGNPKFWSVRDGAITGETTAANPTSGNTFIIWRQGTVGDFELRLLYRLKGGNSGVQYRSKDIGNWVMGGYQADIEAGTNYTGILYEERGRGILAERGQKVVVAPDGQKKVESFAKAETIEAAIKHDDWNEYVIRAEGNHIIQKINGKVTVDFTDEQVDKRAASGLLGFQVHAGPPMTVQFKDITLKRLGP